MNNDAQKFLEEISQQDNFIKEKKFKLVSEILNLAKSLNYEITYNSLINAARKSQNLKISQWIINQTQDLELSPQNLNWVTGGATELDEGFKPGTYGGSTSISFS